MPRVGITGHTNLAHQTSELVRRAIMDALSAWDADDLIGVSCLAAGADSIFAQTVLDIGGHLEVILPAADYREAKVSPEHLPRFDSLLNKARSVEVMPYPRSGRDAYQAANDALLASCDQLIAVWDGEPAGGRGGTADVVQHAQSLGKPVVVIWPDGARREDTKTAMG